MKHENKMIKKETQKNTSIAANGEVSNKAIKKRKCCQNLQMEKIIIFAREWGRGPRAKVPTTIVVIARVVVVGA